MYFKISWHLYAEQTAHLDLLLDMTWCFLQNHVLTPRSHSSLLWTTDKSSCAAQGSAQQHQHWAWWLQRDQDTTFLWKQSFLVPHIKLEKTKGGTGSCNVTKWFLQVFQCSANPHRSGSHRKGHRQVPRGERCTALSHCSKAFSPSMFSASRGTQQYTTPGPNP